MNDLLIVNKRIPLDKCPVLFDRPVGPDSLETDWQRRTGEWKVEGEWLTGRNPDSLAGMITSRRDYFGNVLLDFEARTVLPSTHDIDWMWNGSWDKTTNLRGVAYVCGLQGWYEGKVGFERSPDYTFFAGTPLFPFEPGRIYHIQSGSVDGHVFVFVDGRLVFELMDPNPIDNRRYGLVGFEAYSSMIQIRHPVVRQVVWEKRPQGYAREF